MLAKLKRAKSFVHRTKHEDEKFESDDLGLSETAHLRRNVSINSAVLEKQKQLCMSNESLDTLNRRKLQRQVAGSTKHLQDQVVEQMRRLNFGDSYSNKDIAALRDSKESNEAYLRRHPLYPVERNGHRKSLGAERAEKYSSCGGPSTSGDVANNFDRKNAVYCSERSYLKAAAYIQPEGNLSLGSSDDFLLKRKGLDTMNTIVAKRTPGYIPEGYSPKKKSDILEKTGLRSFFQKLKGHQNECDSRDISDSGFSTGSSTASFGFEDGEQNTQYRRSENTNSRKLDQSGYCSNSSTVSSSGSGRVDTKFKEESISFRDKNVKKHNSSVAQKSNFNRSNKMYFSERQVSKRDLITTDATNIFVSRQSCKGVRSSAIINNRIQAHEDSTQNEMTVKQSSRNRDDVEGLTGNNITARGSEESSRKRQHYQTKSSFDRGQMASLSQRVASRPTKKTGNKFKDEVP